MIEEMLAYNREFVRSKGYEKFQTSKSQTRKSPSSPAWIPVWWSCSPQRWASATVM